MACAGKRFRMMCENCYHIYSPRMSFINYWRWSENGDPKWRRVFWFLNIIFFLLATPVSAEILTENLPLFGGCWGCMHGCTRQQSIDACGRDPGPATQEQVDC